MAEVKRATTSGPQYMKKKPPSYNNNNNNGVTSSSSSTSFKHIYDDVFASPVRVKSSNTFMEDDYAEVFGSSKSSDGIWSIPYSSIPVLELPKAKSSSRGGESVDYGGVFGGGVDGFGLPDGEELFDHLKKKPKTSSVCTLPRSQRQTAEAASSEISGQPYDGKSQTNGFRPSLDNMKHFEPEKKVIINGLNATSGPRKAVHVRAYSLHEVSATSEICSNQTSVIKDDNLETESKLEKKQEKHARHTSLDLGANKQNSNGDTGLQKVPCTRESYSVETSHGPCEPSNSVTNGFCESFDNTVKSKYKINEMTTDKTSGAAHLADVQSIQESNHLLHGFGPTQKTLINRASVASDKTQPVIDVKQASEQRKHSRNTSLDLGAKRHNDECDLIFQKGCALSESTSVDTSHETCQPSVVTGPSKALKDDAETSIGYDEVKKKGRRFRMNSLDLGDYKHSSEHDNALKRKPRFGGSYSFDASHDPCAARVKVQPSKMYPSSSLPQFFPIESYYKVSDNSNHRGSQKNLYGDAGGSPPSLVEELDENSAAAVSAAALQRAIEDAEMRIRLAKEFLERECQGSASLRFKDTLKVRVKENVLAKEEMSKIKQTEMHDCSPIDSYMHPCSPLDRMSVVENDQEPPVFEEQKNFVTDGDELTEGKGEEASKLIKEDDRQEGEWEAAKHINQIISGVKNKLASFMSWQTEADAEKKEELKEMETVMKPQQQPEEVKDDLMIDHEASNKKRNENNPGITASEDLEPGENESIRRFDKAGNKSDFIPETAGPSSANFQFFAFRNQILRASPDPEVEEKMGPQERGESEIENEQEKVINDVKNDITCQDEEASQQEPDDKCVTLTHDTKRQDDMYSSDESFTDVENDKAVEEPCSLAGPNEVEITHDEDMRGTMNRKGDVCFVNEETFEMVGEHFSIAVHDRQEPTHEVGKVDDLSRENHKGIISEENNEMVGEPYSLAEHDEKGPINEEDDGQDALYEKNHIGSSNEEINEIVKEICTLAEHERHGVYEEDNDMSLNDKCKENLTHDSHHCEESTESYKDGECDLLKEAKNQHENVVTNEEFNLVGETWKNIAATEGVFGYQENERDQMEPNRFEEVSGLAYWQEDINIMQSETDHIEEISETVTLEASCIVSAEEGYKQNESAFLSKVDDCSFVESSSKVEEVYTDEEIEKMIETTNTSTEPEVNIESSVSDQTASKLIGECPPVSAQEASDLLGEQPVLSSISTESNTEFVLNGTNEAQSGTIGTLSHENPVSLENESDVSSEQKDDVKVMESEYQESLDYLSSEQKDVDVTVMESEYQESLDYLDESGDNLNVRVSDTASEQDAERSGVEAGHRRRRWFDNRGSIGTSERPSILEGNHVGLEMDQEVLDESELAGSVEIHADKLDCSAAEVTTARNADTSSSHDSNRTNVETTPTRRKWFVKRGEEGTPEPVSLFEGIKVSLEVPLESVNDSVMQDISGHSVDKLNTKSGESQNAVKFDPSDVTINGDKGKQNGEAAPRRRRWFEGGERAGPVQQVRINEDAVTMEINQESKAKGDVENHVKPDNVSISQEVNDVNNKVETVQEQNNNLDDFNRREKERGKEKIAVERVIREARERAFAEARERARRDAAEKPNVEARYKVAAGVQEKLGKVSSEATSSTDKASVEAKLKAERAAVERATAEARERALQKALSEKASHSSREQAGRYSSEKKSSLEPKYQSSRSSDSNNSEKFDGADVESALRRKARLERQKRTMERATNALDEKNRRDVLAQKEQAAKNMLADSLDAEVKRWSAGKEGNLRALLSTLQYILGPDSGWQSVSLTDLVAATAVRKSYKKATLCVHPDKLQQRSASIQQKYICEKVFDLLKEAWSKFNPDER